ncbi:MAG: GNAT family N-acetyltransferase [Pseudomonadota bacterium]
MTVLPAGTEVEYTVTWLQMTSCPTYDWPRLPSGPPATLLQAVHPPRWWFLTLYDAVGRDYAWEDGQQEPPERLQAYLDDGKNMYTLMREGVPAGFFMLDISKDDVTDLTYFGLVPHAIGQGLGTYLLRTAILTGWQREGITRMTVNTCTLDHPRALAHYQKNGFIPVRRGDYKRTLTRDRDTSRIPA